MLFNKRHLVASVILMSTVACSKSSDSDSTTGLSQSLTGVMSTASSSLSEAIPGSDGSSFMPLANIQTEYGTTDVQIFGPTYFTTAQTMVQYVLNKAEDTDPGDGMGLINRFRQKILSGMCPIMGLHPDANNDGIPDVGAGTITLPNFSDTAVVASIEAKCPDANVSNLTGASGATIGYTVTDVSGLAGSKYSIKSEIDFGNNASVDNVVYFKADGAVIRFAFVEVDSSNVDSTTLYEYDGSSLKFDFHGGNQDGHYRIFYNKSTRDVSMYAHLKNDNNNHLHMGIVGNRADTIAALTLNATKSGAAAITNGQACIDVSGTTFPWSSNFSSGSCGSTTGLDFSTVPGVVTHSANFEGSIPLSSFDHTDSVLFTSASEVFTSAIIE